jgi:hypothetical protein
MIIHICQYIYLLAYIKSWTNVYTYICIGAIGRRYRRVDERSMFVYIFIHIYVVTTTLLIIRLHA